MAAALVAATGLGATGCGRSEPASGPADSDAPLTIIFQKQKDPAAIREQADTLAGELAARLGRPVEPVVPSGYGASVQALVSGQADAAFVSALPYLLARRDGDARLILAEVRPDLTGERRTSYDSVFIAAADSGVTGMEDVVARASELRMAFTSTTSTSGYVMAYSRLVDEGLLAAEQDPRDVFAEVIFAGGYAAAIDAVLEGRADVAAVSAYTVEGPTADVYTTAAERERLSVVARTPSVPTHLVCVRGDLDDATAEALADALLAISAEQPELLQQVYGAAELVRVDPDAHVAAAAEAIERLGIELDRFGG
jgi:phosphonate transport system substrate-binding protein